MNQTINISLPKPLLDELRELVKSGEFSSISEAIRHATRNIVKSTTPKYTIVKLSPAAEKRFEKSLSNYQKGDAIAIQSFSDLIE